MRVGLAALALCVCALLAIADSVPGAADVLARGFDARTGQHVGEVFAFDYEHGKPFETYTVPLEVPISGSCWGRPLADAGRRGAPENTK